MIIYLAGCFVLLLMGSARLFLIRFRPLPGSALLALPGIAIAALTSAHVIWPAVSVHRNEDKRSVLALVRS